MKNMSLVMNFAGVSYAYDVQTGVRSAVVTLVSEDLRVVGGETKPVLAMDLVLDEQQAKALERDKQVFLTLPIMVEGQEPEVLEEAPAPVGAPSLAPDSGITAPIESPAPAPAEVPAPEAKTDAEKLVTTGKVKKTA